MNRFRFRNELLQPGVLKYRQFYKEHCLDSAAWSEYYSATSPDWRCGTYRHMDDVIGNAPRRWEGPKGFRFNDMSSASQTIDAGLGQDWVIQTSSEACSGGGNYHPSFARDNQGLTLGRQLCGFKHVIAPDGHLVLPAIGAGPIVDYLRSLTSTRVWSNRARGGSRTNLYEAIAESEKTLKILHEYMSIGKKIVEAYKRRQVGTLLRHTSSAYLMTRYGLAPVVSDIFHTLEALKATLGNVYETTRAREELVDYTSSTSVVPEADTWNHSVRTITETVVAVKAVSVDQYERNQFDSLGLGIKNLATVGWELVPLSFVADWFGNIGDFIGALIPDVGYYQIGSCTSVKVTVKSRFEIMDSVLWAPSTYSVIIPPSGTCSQEVSTYYRTRGLLCPKILIRPNFGFEGNILRIMDAAALIKQRLRD